METASYVSRMAVEDKKFSTTKTVKLKEAKMQTYTKLREFSYGQNHTFVGYGRLAPACCCCERTTRRHIKEFEEKGLLSIKNDGKKRIFVFTSVLPENFSMPATAGISAKDNLSISGELSQQNFSVPVHQAEHAAADTSAPDCQAACLDAGSAHECANSGHKDNLSPVFKNKKIRNITTPPFPPKEAAPEKSVRGGGGFSSSDSSLESKTKIQQDFAKLVAVYPCHAELDKGYAVFRRMYAQLPPMDELLQLVEYEKANNSKWKDNKYVHYLKNWLGQGLYRQAQDLMSITEPLRLRQEQERAMREQTAAAAAMPAHQPRQAVPPSDFDSRQRENIPEIQEKPFDQAEFDQCAALWPEKSSRFEEGTAHCIWLCKLRKGLQPSYEQALAVYTKFRNFADWLAAYGKQPETCEVAT
jgi:hypothetical protein